MDTTPAGTPAPPTLPTIAADAARQTTVTLSEWAVAAQVEALPSGEITFQVANAGSEPHTLAIEGENVSQLSAPIPPGGAGQLTVQLAPGTYRLYCPDGADGASHSDQGMSAPFLVQ